MHPDIIEMIEYVYDIGLPSFDVHESQHRDETIKIHSFKAKEKFSFKNESDLRDTFLSLYKQCRGYKEIFRDGQDTIRRNFNFEKQCDISFENTKSVNFVVQLIISYDDRPRFTITVSGDTPTQKVRCHCIRVLWQDYFQIK